MTHKTPLAPRSQNIRPSSSTHKAAMDDSVHGIEATLIDLGLSRMDAGDGKGGERVHWTPFDSEVFDGEGECFVIRMEKVLMGALRRVPVRDLPYDAVGAYGALME